jgi:hypothetical protein
MGQRVVGRSLYVPQHIASTFCCSAAVRPSVTSTHCRHSDMLKLETLASTTSIGFTSIKIQHLRQRLHPLPRHSAIPLQRTPASHQNAFHMLCKPEALAITVYFLHRHHRHREPASSPACNCASTICYSVASRPCLTSKHTLDAQACGKPEALSSAASTDIPSIVIQHLRPLAPVP